MRWHFRQKPTKETTAGQRPPSCLFVPFVSFCSNPADSSAREREIDARVYRLYGRTPDEIKLVEESSS